jgi:hypothetical protein
MVNPGFDLGFFMAFELALTPMMAFLAGSGHGQFWITPPKVTD